MSHKQETCKTTEDDPQSELAASRWALWNLKESLSLSHTSYSVVAGSEQPGATRSLWMAFFKQVQTAKRGWIKERSPHLEGFITHFVYRHGGVRIATQRERTKVPAPTWWLFFLLVLFPNQETPRTPRPAYSSSPGKQTGSRTEKAKVIPNLLIDPGLTSFSTSAIMFEPSFPPLLPDAPFWLLKSHGPS